MKRNIASNGVQRSGDRVLITGGLGFIGAVITEDFLQAGSRVHIVDSMVSNVTDGSELASRYADLDITEMSVSDFLADGRGLGQYDLIVHAASHVGPASILDNEGTIAQDIVRDVALVVEECCKAGVPLIYFSSAEVYGKSGLLVEAEDIRVPPYYNARIEYALAKLTSEAIVMNSQTRGLRSVIIRPFNVVGPMQSRAGGFVMPTFVQQALGGQPITVFAGGKQKRAFLGARDFARFLTEHVTDEVLNKPRVFNVGNPNNEISVEELAHRVKNLLGSSSPIVYVDAREIYGPRYFEAESIEKLPHLKNARDVGWEPRQELDEIIRETAEYYRSHEDTRGADARQGESELRAKQGARS
ncbi:MAG: NAD(P)-dependent oxidoreductase [Nitrococcus sp.]|nr:NAD(P)-dependent oxidoreductase [Nitrococcus sp.]